MNATDESIPVTQEFFDNVLLEKTSGIEEFGTMRWPLFGLLVLTWVLIYFFVFKGTKSIGKVVYVTAIAPYIMLIVGIWKFQFKGVVRNFSVFSIFLYLPIALLIRGCTLEGAGQGIDYFLGTNGKGDWSKLTDIQVWVNATSQIFNSTGIGFGSLIAFSSFNENNSSLLRKKFKFFLLFFLPLRSEKAGRFEKLLSFAMSHSIVTLGSVSLSCATTPHPSRFSKS